MSIGRFRSIGAAPRARAAAPPVDRATFVIFGVGAHRFAVPVESVERVLRPSASHHAVSYGGRSLPLSDLASALGLALAPSARSRLIVFNQDSRWVVAAVDAVFEVATVDASEVGPPAFDGSRTYLPVGTRGIFSRHGVAVLVLDVSRTLGTVAPHGLLEYTDALGGTAT
jgi:chemotaxis signal transduction protein